MLNSSGACGPLTVMTGSGSENWCTFYMPTRPTLTTMTATSGIQIRARTVLSTERGLTYDHLSERTSPDLGVFEPNLDLRFGISIRLIYGR